MPSQKAQKKITDYFPPAPTVEDDQSPSPSNRDLYDDNHDFDHDNREFEETYAQVYLAFNQLGNHDNSQEAEEPIEVSKEDIPNPLFTSRRCPPPERSPNPASSPHTQSQNSSPQTTSSRSTISTYATQDPAVGMTEYCYTIPMPIIVQEIAAPLAFSSPSSLPVPQQSQHSNARSPGQHTRNSPSSHISSTSGNIKNKCSSKSSGRSSGTYFSHHSTDYIDVQQKDSSQSQKPQSQPRRRHHRRRRPCCRHECSVPASAQHAGSNAGGSGSGSKCSGNGDDREWTAVDSEVYMAFAQVFNATKRIEVDLLELKKLVEGLWKERFGSRG